MIYMRLNRIFLLMLTTLLQASVFGQLSTENYIKTYKSSVPLTGDISGVNNKGNVSEGISYVDGLGRPLQTITRQSSPLGYDVVTFQVYDEYGRVTKSYLPYATTAVDGSSKSSLISNQSTFYQNLVGAGDGSAAFSVSTMEDSELGRVLKQGAPGQSWQPDGVNTYNSSDHSVKYALESNDANEVLLWTSQLPSEEYTTVATNAYGKVNAGVAPTPVYYAANSLLKKKTKDEEGNQVIEYSDKLGRTILKRVQAIAGSPSTTDSNKDLNFASTYYIYDDFGNLICVIPPEATSRLATEYFQAGSTDASKNDFLKRWAFRYRYDGRNRMILKQVPGAEPVYMVYDKRDRLVLTQDGNQRSGVTNAIKYWTFTKYDEFNRPILTGIKDTTTTVQLTQAQMQGVVDAYYNNMTTTTWRKWGESYVGNVANNVHGYTNKSYPVRTGAAAEVDANKYLSVTYYDNYDFRSLWYGTYTYLDENLSEVATYNNYTYHQPDVENTRVVGQVTGTKTKVLDGVSVRGGATWLKAVTYYDDKYRVIQTIADNYKGGIDRMTNILDFTGKVLESKLTHQLAYDIVWSEINNLVLNGKKLYKPTSVAQAFGNNSAVSVNQLPANQDGWVEFTVDNFGLTDNYGREFMFAGLTTNKNNAITSGYVFYLISDNNLSLYTNGVRPLSVQGYNKGDVFRISREGSNIKFYHNYKLLYTATGAPTAAMVVDIDVNKWNSGVVNARASFGGAGVTQTVSQTITRRFEYDHAGRLLKTWHKLNGDSEILLALNEYNELGQLVDKKLHSTVSNGSNAKQSVDYRYNIRGWLTKMNEADVSTLAAGDATKDYFGFELAYNNDLGTGNAANLQYNGNISAMKWSHALSLGTVKENAYNYTYDPLNRIKTSEFREKAAAWNTPANNANRETGFLYDLNGNITQLQRNDKRTSGWMDNLAYTYTGNQLMRVTDTGDDFAGFIDGAPGTGNDFIYDTNGNMINDLNKGIGDAGNRITYNYLNLPETVTKGLNSIRYIYDATGRKLAQVTTFGPQQKQVDYVGEFQYENDQLQFISHEEGRIAMAANKTIYTHDGAATTGITAVTSTLAAVTVNTQTYVRATASGTTTKQGMFPIGGTITVAAGEQYRIRAKGYRITTINNGVHLYIRTNGTDLNWPGAQLAITSTAEAWSEQIITIPAGHTTLQAGVVWNTVANGEQFFLNDFEITKLTTNTTPEYQYNLKDHLGNVRLSFTSKEETETNTATLEPANAITERSQFLRYDNAKLINSSLFDRTNGVAPTTTTGYAQRLNGSANEKYGLAKSISVMPGDVIDAEVYAKYVDPNSANWTGALSTLMSQIAANTAGVVVDGATYTTSTATFPAGFAGLQGTTDNGAPRAYLNWLVFDRNYVFVTGGFKQITTAAKEAGTDVAHERIFNTSPITITQPGYVYIYLSNESTAPVEVFFDEFKVTHTKSPVIQMDDYYPFGLTFNSYQRENSTINQFLYNGKEKQDELGLDWLDYGARMYMPELGRFFTIDRFSEKYLSINPYHYGADNPVFYVDINGDSIVSIIRDRNKIKIENSPLKEGESNFINTIVLDVAQDEVTDYSASIINDAMVSVSDNEVVVTSVYRSPEEQADIMYENLENGTVEGEKDTYSASGDIVIDKYVELKKFNEEIGERYTPNNIKTIMTGIIQREGPSNVSKHSSIPKIYNVIDIAPSTISDFKAFHKALDDDTRVNKVLSPVNKPAEKAVHVEIKQK